MTELEALEAEVALLLVEKAELQQELAAAHAATAQARCSLLDQFALSAINGVAWQKKPPIGGLNVSDEQAAEFIARRAYTVARAMATERTR